LPRESSTAWFDLRASEKRALCGDAWLAGWIEPGTLSAVDFRRKLPGAQANQRGVALTGRRRDAGAGDPPDGWLGRSSSLFGSEYNLGFLQYEACDYCDDVVAETADITIGDAWLPEYIVDGAGTNIVIVRSPDLLEILRTAAQNGQLALEEVAPEKAIRSQAGGFRQRREGWLIACTCVKKKGSGIRRSGWRQITAILPHTASRYTRPACSYRGKAGGFSSKPWRAMIMPYLTGRCAPWWRAPSARIGGVS